MLLTTVRLAHTGGGGGGTQSRVWIRNPCPLCALLHCLTGKSAGTCQDYIDQCKDLDVKLEESLARVEVLRAAHLLATNQMYDFEKVALRDFNKARPPPPPRCFVDMLGGPPRC